jgi:DedD protein
MEQALKERLVGAVVLVGIAVLLIPELLSGRKPAAADADTANGARTYTIELQPPRSSNQADVASAPELPERPRSASLTLPAPADDVTTEQAGAGPGVDARDRPTQRADAVSPTRGSPQSRNDAPSSAGDPAAGAVPALGGLAVQVGAFGSEEAANRLVRELQSKGFDAYLSPVERAGKTLQRVRVGPAPDAATAAATAERLKQLGYGSAVVVAT